MTNGSIEFSSGCPEYYTAVTQEQSFKTADLIKKQIRASSLCYKYGNVTWNSFKKLYPVEDQSKESKLVIIRDMLLEIIRALGNLLMSVFKTIKFDFPLSKLNVYRAGRSLEKAYGHFLMLFSQQVLSVQQSLFQKQCYGYFEEMHEANIHVITNFSLTCKNGIIIPHAKDAETMTLLDFKKCSFNQREAVLEKFKLTGKISDESFKKIDLLNDELLSSIGLETVIISAAHNQLNYLLLSDDEFSILSLKEYMNVCQEVKDILRDRLLHFKNESLPTIDLGTDISKITLIQFRNLSTQTIQALLPEIKHSRCLLVLIDERHFKGENPLDITSLDTFENLFGWRGEGDKSNEVLFRLVPNSQMQKILDKLPKFMMEKITPDRFKETENQRALDISDLDTSKLNDLFGWRGNDLSNEVLFRAVPNSQIQNVLTKLSKNLMLMITQDRFKEVENQRPLDISELNTKKLDDLFGWRGNDLSNEVLLSAVPDDQFKVIFKKFSTSLMKLVKLDRLPIVDFIGMGKEQVDALFPEYSIQILSDESAQHFYSRSWNYKSHGAGGMPECHENIQIGLPFDKIQKKSEGIKTSNLAKFEKLTQQQYDQIKGMLSEDNQLLARQKGLN